MSIKLPHHTKYKKISAKWLSEVPEHWIQLKLKHLASKITDGAHVSPETEGGEFYFVSTKDIVESGIDFSSALLTSASSYEALVKSGCKPKRGDVLFSKDGTIGKTVVIRDDLDFVVASSLIIIQPDPRRVDSQFLHYLCQSSLITAQVESFVKGAGLPRLSIQNLLKVEGLILPLDEQQRIVGFLNSEVGKIDALLGELLKLIKLLNEKVTSLVLSSVGLIETREVRLHCAAQLIKRPVFQREAEAYTALGLLNRGRGIFHKDSREIGGMGDSDFFWIEGGDLIISGQFAWEGAVALAGLEDSGCVVSHRYHVLCGTPGIALTEYLLALLLTKHGDFLLNENSRGAAGRNRPLNINHLLKEKVPIPQMQVQERVARAVHRRKALLREMSNQVELLKERRAALISAAVTGQIDVRNYRPQEAAVFCQ